MPRTLTDRQQRVVFGALVVVLVAFGIYLSIGGFGGGDEQDADGQGPQAGGGQEDRADTGAPATAAPSPIPTTDVQDVQVLDLLPLEEDELKAAAATAQGFAEAYGTIDYTGTREAYFASLEELAAPDYAETLAQSSGAGALWDEMAEKETTAEGRAEVESIRSFSENSVVFVVTAQSIVQNSDGADENLGDYAVTVQKEGGQWEVYDLQPADAGNLGGG
ncbi:hypothetical protein O4J56_02240 [Nocardiopsis sp. RSe5-2]|uniref:Mce-associated membrane protein n=1 Tax=Nocardiopsis endophytica TaxID=3018445 RepID=A0ABT4TXL5_9ACTN|nr:hypothetical protein [Nocardiopsis endophytica]MDA2809446.1 hypothetical protein [Nocardiopsis endophytica]